ERAVRCGAADFFEQWILGTHFDAGSKAGVQAGGLRYAYNNAKEYRMRVVLRVGAGLLALAAITAGVGIARGSGEIERQSELEEARPADIIIVLGAAEYRGRPSPVLEARLNHAIFLYRQRMAPRILTTGGAGGDPNFTEGEVAHNYLSRHDI